MARLYEENQTPEWMKPLKQLHQRRKSEQSEKEKAERRKAEEERQRFEAMPAWKKQLIYKKRAKSAENLLTGSSVKDPNKSETKASDAVNSECNGNVPMKPVEKGEINAKCHAGTDDDSENSNSDKKNHEEHAVGHEVETSGDEIENKPEKNEVEDSGDDHKTEEVDESEGEETELAEKIGEVNNNLDDDETDVNEGENDNHNVELAIESSQNKSKEGPQNTSECQDGADMSDNEKMIQCIDPDEGGSEESGEEQVDGSSVPAEIDNNNEDKNE